MKQVKTQLKKLSGGGSLPPRPSLRDVVIGFVGGSLGILGLYGLSLITAFPVLLAPFGATAALLFAAPKAPFAQPRNIMGGYLVSTIVGISFSWLFDSHPLAMGLSVGLSIALMQIIRMMHPPGGGVPLVIMLAGSPLLSPLDAFVSILLGAVYMIVLSVVLNSLGKEQRWPHYWWGQHKN